MTNEAPALEARATARSLLAGLDSRWAHVQGVAARAEELGAPGVVLTAAWLHDVGYAEQLLDCGMHAIDGARYLERRGWPPVISGLVAHHTGARFEAEQRGLVEALDEFPDAAPRPPRRTDPVRPHGRTRRYRRADRRAARRDPRALPQATPGPYRRATITPPARAGVPARPGLPRSIRGLGTLGPLVRAGCAASSRGACPGRPARRGRTTRPRCSPNWSARTRR